MPYSGSEQQCSSCYNELVFSPELHQPCLDTQSYLNVYCLPEDFVWGVAGSPCQIDRAI